MAVTYVAYIDESGDPGTAGIKPGGSEWFILSCLVTQIHNVPSLGNTHSAILKKFKNCQTDEIHFNRLIPVKKTIACEELSNTPCRAFVAISNKKNMIEYRKNVLSNEGQWFYWFMTRILLEKVTSFCNRHAKRDGILNPKLRIIFSRRGGNNYQQLTGYLNKLKFQSEVGGLYLNQYDITWPLIDMDEIHIVDAANSIGLQLSDVIAGSFYKGLHIGKNGVDMTFAKTLKPIMARCEKGQWINFGIKTRPSLFEMDAPKDLFRYYGYKGR